MTRGGWGSKLHLMVEAGGLPLAMVLTRGNRNECPVFPELLIQSVKNMSGRTPVRLAADKGYSSDRIRKGLIEQSIQQVIPMRNNEHVEDKDVFGKFDAEAYRGRNVVERCVGKLKEMRRIATRYEKLAGNYAGMVTLAMVVLYLRMLG